MKTLDVQGFPTWALWLFAALFACFFGYMVLRMLAPDVRRGQGGRVVGGALVLFFVWAAVGRGDRTVLWFGAVGFFLVSLPLLWMGRLPDDMPSARSPAARAHARYDEIARRGRIAGFVMVGLILAEIVLTEVFVRGL